jgi:hypothetical protein
VSGEYDYGCLCCGWMFDLGTGEAGEAGEAADSATLAPAPAPAPAPADEAQSRTDCGPGPDGQEAVALPGHGAGSVTGR